MPTGWAKLVVARTLYARHRRESRSNTHDHDFLHIAGKRCTTPHHSASVGLVDADSIAGAERLDRIGLTRTFQGGTMQSRRATRKRALITGIAATAAIGLLVGCTSDG